jgi:carbamoyltransferase
MKKPDLWIAAIARGHNAGVCLLKNGEVIFSIEEERLSRHKYDGGPFASMVKILEYTDKLDYLVVAHTQSLQDTAGKVDFTGDDVYTGLARKLGLISRDPKLLPQHPQVIDLSYFHHKLHAALAFYNSGFDDAVAVIVDGAGTFFSANLQGENGPSTTLWETETIYDCEYPINFKTLYKHLGTIGPLTGAEFHNFDGGFFAEEGAVPEVVLTETAGIVKTYEAVTDYCGFSFIEAGKTMGLFPYGKENKENVPQLFTTDQTNPLSNRNAIIPNYPNGAFVNRNYFEYLRDKKDQDEDVTKLNNRRDMAYAVQTQTQKQVANLIRKAVKMSGKKNVVLSGGYGLNCVANYYYLKELQDEGINLYVEPVSNDAGTAMGAAMLQHRAITKDNTVHPQKETLYNGPQYNYSAEEIQKVADRYEAQVSEATHEDVVELITNKNIVAIFQGKSENGPRALGNRSFLYDPRDPNGKDHVNKVKRREYFRPFAGTILEEDVHEWFDLRGMKSSPTMMYAVNCQPGIEEKIPAIIHVDGTCRIQTVNEEQNKNYYNLIKIFKEKTGCPIVFNTSFNLGGDPLVETLDNAVYTLAKSDIEYLYLPEYATLITVKN